LLISTFSNKSLKSFLVRMANSVFSLQTIVALLSSPNNNPKSPKHYPSYKKFFYIFFRKNIWKWTDMVLTTSKKKKFFLKKKKI